MKRVLYIICSFIFAPIAHAQLPILYYDFENNTNRSTYETTVEQSVNSGCSSIITSGSLSLGGATGAGLSYTGGSANGEGISANSTWSTATSDPGIAATTYFQFTVNTSGFSGLSIQFDCTSSNTILTLFGVGPQNVGILYSTDGTTYHTTSTKAMPSLGSWDHLNFDLSAITAINNQSNVYFRLYGYNAADILNILFQIIPNTTGTLSIDNLQVDALSTVSNAGTLTLLNETGIYTSTTSGTTGSIFSRQNFTVSGTSTTVNMGEEKFTGTGITAGNLTVQDTAVLNITTAVTIDSAITATSTPLSTLTVNTYATVNLSSANLLSKGSTTIANTGTFNCVTNTVTNTGAFTVSSGGTLGIGSTQGISSSGATGNIQTTTRSFNTGGNYTYNGTANQITGSGLPSTVNNLTINNASHFITLTNGLTVSNQTSLMAGSLIIGSTTLTLNGAVTSTLGNLDGTSNSALVLDGSSAQSISFDINDSLSTLTINKSSGSTATLNSALNIFTGIVFNASNLGTLDLNSQHVTMKSSATTTAYVGQLYGTLNNATNVTIERYIPGHRAWRMIGVPLSSSGAPTINESWQEGGVVTTVGGTSNPNPGYGTDITGGSAINGFDQNGKNTPSLETYNNAAGAWNSLPNTESIPITNYPGYMLFVRGSRANNLSSLTYAAVDNTVLRATGKLLTGTQIFSASVAGFNLITNPYASTINYHTTTKSGVPDTYYLWDPLITGSNGVGAFITLTRIGSSYVSAPTPISPIDMNGSIESGASFFVHFISSGSLQINESDKTTGSAVVFRPASGNETQDTINRLLRIDLYDLNADSSTTLLDGVLTAYDSSYSDSVDDMDAKKIGNVAEDIILQRAGVSLAIEKRQPVNSNDTVFFRLSQAQQIPYQLMFTATNLNQPGLTGMLVDNYLNKTTPVNLNGTTAVNISITADAASSSANRFMVLFAPSTVLPVLFKSISGYLQNATIAVQWQMSDQINIASYEVEKSSDTINFKKVATVTAGKNPAYNWVDANPITGNNYYRIKSIASNGTSAYSKIINVPVENNNTDNMTVLNNPVIGNTVQLQLKNMPLGTYNARLINTAGQVLFKQYINHVAVTDTQSIELPVTVARGIFQLELSALGMMNAVTTKLLLK